MLWLLLRLLGLGKVYSCILTCFVNSVSFHFFHPSAFSLSLHLFLLKPQNSLVSLPSLFSFKICDFLSYPGCSFNTSYSYSFDLPPFLSLLPTTLHTLLSWVQQYCGPLSRFTPCCLLHTCHMSTKMFYTKFHA